MIVISMGTEESGIQPVWLGPDIETVRTWLRMNGFDREIDKADADTVEQYWKWLIDGTMLWAVPKEVEPIHASADLQRLQRIEAAARDYCAINGVKRYNRLIEALNEGK